MDLWQFDDTACSVTMIYVIISQFPEGFHLRKVDRCDIEFFEGFSQAPRFNIPQRLALESHIRDRVENDRGRRREG